MLSDRQYRFEATAIGLDGRIGPAISSQWIDTFSINRRFLAPTDLRLGEQQLLPNHVNGVLSWRVQEHPTEQSSCYYEIFIGKHGPFDGAEDPRLFILVGIHFLYLRIDFVRVWRIFLG